MGVLNLNKYFNPIKDAFVRSALFEFQKQYNALYNPFYPNPSGGKDYFVDGNTQNTIQDGATWATAFDTLAEALAASHARIGTAAYRSWAVRNRIFVVGDALVEDLTALAQKTDVIGVGQCDGFGPGARIQGNHVIGTTSYAGCRLINLAFLYRDW